MPKKPIQPQDKYVLRLPDGLRDRIKRYADRHGRSMNAEIVRVLEREYPEQWTVDRRVAELLEMLEVLKGGEANAAINHLLAEIEETLDAVWSGRMTGLSEEERKAVERRYTHWREDQVKGAWSEEPELDPEEERMRDLTGSTQKFLDPEFPE